MASPTVTIRIDANAASAVAGIEQAKASVGGLGKAGEEAGRRGAAGMSNVNKSAQDAARNVGSLTDMVKGLAAGFLTIQSVRGLITLADQAANLNARLRLVSDGQREFSAAQAETFAIAQRTSSALESTVTLYARLRQSTADYGIEQARLLSITETINQTFAVSGASASAQSNAIIQLTQAFAGGVLRAEEFNSIIENSPRLAQAFAQGLGVSTGALRKMVNDGEVDIQRMIDALESQATTVATEFERLPLTVERSWTQLQNAVLTYVGRANDGIGASTALASSIQFIARNIDVLATGITVAAAAWTGKYVVAMTIVAAQKAEATIASVALARAELAEARTAEAAAAAQLTKLQAMRAAGLAVTQLTAAETALAAAQARTATAAAASAGILARTGSAILGIVGGPLGALVLGITGAAVAYAALTGDSDDLADASARMDAALRKVSASTGASRDAALQAAEAEREKFAVSVDAERALLREAQARLEVARAMQQFNSHRAEGASTAAREFEAVGQLTEGVAELTIALGRADMELVKAQGTTAQWAGRLREAAKDIDGELIPAIGRWIGEMLIADAQVRSLQSMPSYGDAVKGLQEQVTKLRKQNIEMTQGTEAAVRFAVATELGVDASADLGDELNALIGEVVSLTTHNRALAESKRTAAAAGREQAKAEREEAAIKREIEAATSAADSAYLSLMQTLDPLTAIEMDHAAQLQEIDKWHAAGAISAARYAEMKAMVGKVSTQAVAAFHKERDVLGRVTSAYDEEMKVLRMGARAAFIHAEAQDAINEAIGAGKPLREDEIRDIKERAAALYDTREAVAEVERILSEFKNESPVLSLVEGLGKVASALADLPERMDEAFDPERAKELEQAFAQVSARLQVDMVGSYKALLGAAQTYTKEGSKGFHVMEAGMAALSIVQDLIALKAAVSAVLTQGQGDPYSAWARMAAMAAAVAPFLASIGVTLSSFSGDGGGPTTAADRQATQGTGTVLGDMEAKSESIARATEITADATTTLVGINRGMLSALLSLQSAIAGATGMLARGAGNVEFGAFDPGTMLNARNGAAMGAAIGSVIPIIGTAIGMVVGAVLGSVLRGSSRLSDQGIVVGGGSLEDMGFEAYQEHEVRRWRFGSRRNVEQRGDLPEDVANQFGLVMDSIVETVREAALALGMLPADIEAALATYRQEEIRISLMDLSAEEQEAELAAVFSSIFDGLAGHVVPFIEQFQQVGEGLGETLVRVATSVQVVQESMRYLGIAIDETDPEKFAQISVSLVEMAGGIEEFISQMMSFADKFAPDDFKFEAAQSALTEAFDEFGLSIPPTREAMWALMQSFDATTEEGRKQIAMLLRLADAADEYYDSLDDQAEAAERAANATRDLNTLLVDLAADGWSEPVRAVMRLDQEYRDHVATIQRLARESGRAEASEGELAIARAWHTRQLRKLAAELMQSAASIASQLGYAGFEDAGASVDPVFDNEMGGIADVAQAVEDRYARELQLLQQLDEYVRSLNTSALSPLTPAEQLAEAQAEYERLLALAQGGDLDALAQLQGAANTYLTQAQDYYGGVGAYEGIFAGVRDTLADLVAAGPQNDPTQQGPNTPVYGGPVTVQPGDGWAAQNAIERAALAQQLVDHLAALSLAINEPILELMETMGIPIIKLVDDLGINIKEITGASVEALAALAHDLGLPLGELVSAIGLELPDLADGIRELADELGYNLDELISETGKGLYDMAVLLGVDLNELAESLGQDLGKLTDVNSPIYKALEQTIGQLPTEQANKLSDYLNAISTAPTGEVAAQEIAKMEDYINTLPADIRDDLAPFFEGVDPAGSLSQLDYLASMSVSMSDVLQEVVAMNGQQGWLSKIHGSLAAQNAATGLPAYATGGWVNGPTAILAGEAGRELILDNHVSEFLARAGIPVNTVGDTSLIADELRKLRAEVAQLRAERVSADDRKVQLAEAGVDAANRNARAAERQADVMEMRA